MGEAKRQEGLVWYITSSLPPSFPATSSNVLPKKQKKQSVILSSPLAFCLSLSLSQSPIFFTPVSSLHLLPLSHNVYLFEHGAVRTHGDLEPTPRADVTAQLSLLLQLQPKKSLRDVLYPTFYISPSHTRVLLRNYADHLGGDLPKYDALFNFKGKNASVHTENSTFLHTLFHVYALKCYLHHLAKSAHDCFIGGAACHGENPRHGLANAYTHGHTPPPDTNNNFRPKQWCQDVLISVCVCARMHVCVLLEAFWSVLPQDMPVL